MPRNKIAFVLYYLISSVILIYLSNKLNPDSQSPIFFDVSFVIIANLVLSVMLNILKENFFAIFEIKSAKKAYANARNRIQFFRNGEIVCLEGTVEAEDATQTLLTPITNQKAISYTYGNPLITGGYEQIRSVVKPSGESVFLNGMLSLSYFPNHSYDPKQYNLTNFKNFILSKKGQSFDSNSLTLDYIANNMGKNCTQSMHNTEPSFSEEEFSKYVYNEQFIPNGAYSWVLGRWSRRNKELLPLKFSNCIFVIEEDYKKNFYEYITMQERKYSKGSSIFLFIVFFILMVLLFVIML